MSNAGRNNCIDNVEFPVMDAEQLTASKDFYLKVFGWEFKSWGSEYADSQSSSVTNGLAVSPDRLYRPLPIVYSADLEGARNTAIAAGARLSKDIFSFPGGRRFQFTDPAGNELAVWSDK